MRSYLVNYRAEGGGRRAANRRLVIGRHGRVTAEQARRIAHETLGKVAAGEDPAEGRTRSRSTPTLREAFEEFLSVGPARKPRTVEVYRRTVYHDLADWVDRSLNNISRKDVEQCFTRCFLPVHVYHVESGRPVAVLLRPGKTPSGVEVRTMLKHLTRRIRRHWPRTRLTFRGDSHYGRTEAMAWCEDNGVDYIFGLAGNAVLHALAGETGEKVRARHAEAGGDKVRGFADFAYAAGSWNRARRVVARLEATTRGFDARYIVTSLEGEPRHLYEGIYCARGQAENLIKLHKSQLASDRTSCQSPLANQFRLVLHTAAYWLMLALRDAVPRRMPLHWAEFATLRQKLLKIGARVVEKAARVRIHFASACPDADLFRMLAGRLAASGP